MGSSILRSAALAVLIAALPACGDGGNGKAPAPGNSRQGAAADNQPAKKAANVDATRIENADVAPGDWLTTGRTYSEQRFSPLAKINDENVDKLGLAWSYKLDVNRGTEATPIVVDGVMYTTGAYSIVYALDPVTGKLLWKYDPEVNRAVAGKACCGVNNRGVAVWKGKVYVGVFDGRLVALDANTGKVAWQTDTLIDDAANYTITGAPRIVKGKVIIGNGGAELGVRGYVSAYDAGTGELAWRFYTVPGDPDKPVENPILKKARKTWFGDSYWKQGGGGTVWDSMAYDPDLDQLYIGVGNGSPWNIAKRSEGRGDNLFLSSIVALDPDTGKYIWHYQTTPGDSWDYTATQHMILADLKIDGEPRKVLMQAPKNGFFYVIDRETGELISAENFVPVNWASGIDPKTGRPIKTGKADYSKEPKTVTPSPLGAHNWQPMSYNPNTGLVYIPAQYSALYFQNGAGTPQTGRNVWNVGVAPFNIPADPEVLKALDKQFHGALLAWDPVKQKAAWTVDYPSIWNGGTLTTAGNLVFEGTAQTQQVRAYAADSGKLLWQSPANTGVIAAPVTYAIDGVQYVTFMAGWGGAYALTTSGLFDETARIRSESRVLTYKLGGNQTLPQPEHKTLPVPEPPPVTAKPKQVAIGKQLYNGYCATCHGVNAMSGGVVPDLRYIDAETHEQFSAIVKGARAARGMPPFGHVLDNAKTGLIHQYLIKRSHDLVKHIDQTRH